MFTGLVEGTGKFLSNTNNRLVIELDNFPYSEGDIKIGDSVCVNGICLTAVDVNGKKIGFDVSRESLSVTNIATLNSGAKVNIEKSMSASGRFHGHFVSGHIDTVGKISRIIKNSNSWDLFVEIDNKYLGSLRWLAEKGSVCLNGVSLTVNELVAKNTFRLTLIPHTVKKTNLTDLSTGDRVNIEFDILAKYVQNMINGHAEKPLDKGSEVTEAFLKENGYVR
ncbi:MAG: riboflavin synthase [bacterium]